MELMIIKDVMIVEGKGLVLTGPLLLVDVVVRRSDVEWLVGKQVTVSANNGRQLNLCVNAISVRQTMSGATETSLGVEISPDGMNILVDSIVTVDG